MEITEQPADDGITEGLKIVSYSLNSKGEYELVPGLGWQPVNVVNHQAWQEIEKKIASSREQVTAGRVSCLHYYMTANQMDIGLLARYTGQSRWLVRLHLVPFVFSRLRPDTLKKYADLFQVLPDDLVRGELKTPIYQHS
ncbi:hypothetical protein BMS3Bbin14_02220 [bacterium BMS3Bbin14]|nr:hypothetical protein BMS3Abin13_00263 [bacterium BMS3Abin13]GBE53718.1 hypothetical protein BMS3Bbin14_02220 [bacterium BMS3Bbin14]HDK43335.1 hypothetical protein [Desulfobacteraceae bacterium]HDL98089.1 hypothetical protein [Desulfobacteraceae bacterium]HDZ75936.1 hypothetical protein [Desulfobacteraceae bacterium]